MKASSQLVISVGMETVMVPPYLGVSAVGCVVVVVDAVDVVVVDVVVVVVVVNAVVVVK